MVTGVSFKAYRLSLIVSDTTKSSNRWGPLVKFALIEDVYSERVVGSVCSSTFIRF
jgi:hypothetical protein